MIRRVWEWFFPRRELIGLGVTHWRFVGANDDRPRIVQWFFYRRGGRHFIEFGPGSNKDAALELWAAEARLWEEFGRLPEFADPVAAKIIQDSVS